MVKTKVVLFLNTIQERLLDLMLHSRKLNIKVLILFHSSNAPTYYICYSLSMRKHSRGNTYIYIVTECIT